MTTLSKKTILFLTINIIIGVGIICAILLSKNYDSIGIIARDHSKDFVFTSPILDFEFSQEFSNTIIPSNLARNFVENIKEDKNIKHISVYFRDLNNGPWVGINEKEYFSPASMLKTPLLISLLKWSETDPSILNKEILVDNKFFDSNLSQHMNVVGGVALGERYTFLEIATKMIQQSDNVAAKILYENIPQNFIDDTYTNIGVSFVPNGEDTFIRVKDIAAFYRVLFNASYLNRYNSEKALSILSNTSYKDGIVSGVPKNINVAHKFGERFSSVVVTPLNFIPEGDIQVHDCGIVYIPTMPYILCVMTRGEDFKLQQQAISEISNFFYRQVVK